MLLIFVRDEGADVGGFVKLRRFGLLEFALYAVLPACQIEVA